MKTFLLAAMLLVNQTVLAEDQNCQFSELNKLTETVGGMCDLASGAKPADGTVDPKPIRKVIEEKLRELFVRFKKNPNDGEWNEYSAVGPDVKKKFLDAFTGTDGQIDEVKLQNLVDHLAEKSKHCDVGTEKSKGVRYKTSFHLTQNQEFTQAYATFLGPTRQTAAQEYVKNTQYSQQGGEFLSDCHVYSEPSCKDDPPAAAKSPLTDADLGIVAKLEEPAALRVGLFKPNSSVFKDPDKAQKVLIGELEPFTKGTVKKLTKIKINTCSSMDRNCATGSGSDPACNIIGAMKKYSDQELLDPKNRVMLGLDGEAYDALKDVLTDKSLGYLGQVGKIYGNPSALGYELDQGDEAGRELRTWLFLSAYRGRAIRNLVKNDKSDSYKNVQFEVNPTGVQDEGFGFSNAAILPGTCGGHFGNDQFFGKYCTDGAVADSKCSRNLSGIKSICAAIKDKYTNIAKDYDSKLAEYKANNPNLPDNNESKYAMSRYAQMEPEVIDEVPPPSVTGKPGEQQASGGECRVYCRKFGSFCSTVGKETPLKKIVTTMKTFVTASPNDKGPSKKNRGSTKCPVNF